MPSLGFMSSKSSVRKSLKNHGACRSSRWKVVDAHRMRMYEITSKVSMGLPTPTISSERLLIDIVQIGLSRLIFLATFVQLGVEMHHSQLCVKHIHYNLPNCRRSWEANHLREDLLGHVPNRNPRTVWSCVTQRASSRLEIFTSTPSLSLVSNSFPGYAYDPSRKPNNLARL
jgi:hypothetical protein